MRTLSKFALVPAFALLAACGRDDRSPAVDDALQNDLALAAAAQPYQAQQFVSPLEQGYAGAYAPQYAPAGYAPAPQPYYTPAAPARRAPASRPRATSTASSGTVYRAPAPAPVIKNTKRDAVIGSVAGAAIGVATSSKKDRLKGGLLGAVAGAAIGAVVGNNVDVQRP